MGLTIRTVVERNARDQIIVTSLITDDRPLGRVLELVSRPLRTLDTAAEMRTVAAEPWAQPA